jgi:hypothetical protein
MDGADQALENAREIPVDLHADAHFNKAGTCPSHGYSSSKLGLMADNAGTIRAR